MKNELKKQGKMKTTILLTLTGLFLLASCAGENKKNNEKMFQNETTLQTQSQNEAIAENIVDEDTTIYDMPTTGAVMQNAVNYLRENNKFKDWNKNDIQKVFVRGVVEKDGKLSTIVKVGGTENEELKKEAFRLLKGATITPATNEKRQPVRSYWTNVVEFPPK